MRSAVARVFCSSPGGIAITASARGRADRAGLRRRDRLVGDDEAPSRARPRRPRDRVLADPDRVVARGARRPQQHQPGGRRAQRRERAAHDVRVPGAGDDRVRGVLVQRRASGEQPGERVAVAGERAALAGGAAPRGLEVDVDEHDGVAAQRRARALGQHRPAAERDDAAVGAVEHRRDELLLRGPERRLARAVEVRLDRSRRARPRAGRRCRPRSRRARPPPRGPPSTCRRP